MSPTWQVFGGEIPRGESIKLLKTKLAIFSWTGGTVSVVGEPKAVYKVPCLCVLRERVLVFWLCPVCVSEFLAGFTWVCSVCLHVFIGCLESILSVICVYRSWGSCVLSMFLCCVCGPHVYRAFVMCVNVCCLCVTNVCPECG